MSYTFKVPAASLTYCMEGDGGELLVMPDVKRPTVECCKCGSRGEKHGKKWIWTRSAKASAAHRKVLAAQHGMKVGPHPWDMNLKEEGA